MHRFPSDFTFNPQSTPLTSVASSPVPALQPPTDDAIEAVILQATSARQASEPRPLRDTRTQLFIGNLPYRVRWQDLKDLFRKAGTVLRADVSLGADNRSRGYGTVLLATAEDAGRAVDMFNGYSWQSRVLEVRLDRLLPEYEIQPVATGSSPASASSSSYPTASTSSHQGSSSSLSEEHEYMSTYQSNDPASCRNLFVGNLPFHCQWQDLKDLFRQAGTILRADVALGPDGRSRGFGTVVFATEYDAERAVKMFNGFEYNNRILKVNYDKFSQANQPITASGSPVTANTQGQLYGNNIQIKLPPGFMLDFVPQSGPTSPYEMFSQLQQQQQQQRQQNRQPSQMLHQPQAQHYLQQQHLQQQRLQQQPQQQSSHAYNLQSTLDIESLTNTLASSHLSKPSQTSQRTASAHKPSPISTAASSTRTSSSSEQSMASTSASSVSHSPNPLHTLQQNQAQQQPQHQHPHHPGPITLPPLRAPIFPLAPHTPQASTGMPPSPVYHPNMGSPYQMYSTSAASQSAAYQPHYHQQQHRAQMMPLTPHGLPPITPSMPPFTFLPPSFNHGHHQAARAAAQHQHQQHVSSSSKDSSASGSSAANPASSSSSSASSSASASATSYDPSSSDSANNNPNNPQTMQYATYATPNQHFIVPLPSPGLYMAAQPPQPSPPLHLRLNLAGIPGAFSPGVAMSPGTFYGRPGEVPNPNPFINAAVGAPVHVHSPGGHGGPPMGGSPGGMMPMYGQPHVTHGAYFYAMSSPKKGPPSGMEPKGYFDPMYFPVGAVGVGGGGGVGGSGLANEIMRDKDSNSGSVEDKERKDPMEAEEFSSPPGETSVSIGTEETEASASAASSGSSLTSWYTGDMVGGASPDVAAAEKSGHEQDPKSGSGDEGTSGSDETVSVLKLGEGSTISRTHSVGYKKKIISVVTEGPGTMSRGNSDPVYGSSTSDTGDAKTEAVAQLTLRLPEWATWSRKQEAVVQTPTARTASVDYLDAGARGEQEPSTSSMSLPTTTTQ